MASETMNVYRVEADDVGWLHVVAASRGKAKVIYLAYVDCQIDWTECFSIRLLEKNTSLPEGVDEVFAWAKANGVPYGEREWADAT